MSRRSTAGRPEATSHTAIERAAFDLFLSQGFEQTTLDQIAEAVGVTRRTIFRYYASKNDIPWGQFDDTLVSFRNLLHNQPSTIPLHQALGNALVEFNDFPEGADPSHADRMRLLLRTPTLLAHSALKYAEWRAVVSEYAGVRLGVPPDSLAPRLLGHVALAVALSAYEQWLTEPSPSPAGLVDILRGANRALRDTYTHLDPLSPE